MATAVTTSSSFSGTSVPAPPATTSEANRPPQTCPAPRPRAAYCRCTNRKFARREPSRSEIMRCSSILRTDTPREFTATIICGRSAGARSAPRRFAAEFVHRSWGFARQATQAGVRRVQIHARLNAPEYARRRREIAGQSALSTLGVPARAAAGCRPARAGSAHGMNFLRSALETTSRIEDRLSKRSLVHCRQVICGK
jgi:hypothetical protein